MCRSFILDVSVKYCDETKRGVQMFEFKDFDYLTDGGIDLKIEEKTPSNEGKGYVPA